MTESMLKGLALVGGLTAACGTGTASASGAYPSVFNNNLVDGSFGITAPIFLDQITPFGTPVNTLAIPSNLIVTSFSSKSELAMNLSADGTALTLMGYVAPPNTLDVSNSNTPGVYDPTNPAGGSYFRGVAQIGADGAIQVTPTNAYSGNNGRAAVLANGLYYMVGNSNNGAGKPLARVVASTCHQGQRQQWHQYGVPGRERRRLPTLANAATAPITILPGFPTVLAKNAGASVWYMVRERVHAVRRR